MRSLNMPTKSENVKVMRSLCGTHGDLMYVAQMQEQTQTPHECFNNSTSLILKHPGSILKSSHSGRVKEHVGRFPNLYVHPVAYIPHILLHIFPTEHTFRVAVFCDYCNLSISQQQVDPPADHSESI